MGLFGLQWSDFLLDHDNPWLFYSPQCRVPIAVFLVYRWIVGLYTLAIITFNQVYKFDRDPNPFVYLTNWNFMFQAIALCLKAVVATYKSCQKTGELQSSKRVPSMAWYLKLEWLLHNISSTIPFTVLMYWRTFQYEKLIKMGTPFFLFFTVQTHGLTAILAIVDILFGATPSRLLHFYQPLLFLVFYYTFSIIYYGATGGKLIYPNVNWTPGYIGSTLKDILLNLLVALAAHLVACTLKALQGRFCCSSGRDKKGEETQPLIGADAIFGGQGKSKSSLLIDV